MLIDGRQSLVGWWHDEASALARALNHRRLAVRVAVDQRAVMPQRPQADSRVQMTIERDRTSFRGAGGVLHDLARDYADEDYLFVANAGQVLLEPLPELVARLAAQETDVSIVSHPMERRRGWCSCGAVC